MAENKITVVAVAGPQHPEKQRQPFILLKN